jgi:hypothetical protein
MRGWLRRLWVGLHQTTALKLVAWMALGILGVCALNTWYANLVGSQAKAAAAKANAAAAQASANLRHFCDLMTTLDDVNRAQPPATATGRLIAIQIHALTIQLGCKED